MTSFDVGEFEQIQGRQRSAHGHVRPLTSSTGQKVLGVGSNSEQITYKRTSLKNRSCDLKRWTASLPIFVVVRNDERWCGNEVLISVMLLYERS